MLSKPRLVLEVGSRVLRPLPVSVAAGLGEALGRFVGRRGGPRVVALERNLAAVLPAASSEELARLAVDGFGTYGRYWAESLRLPSLSAEAIDRGFDVVGYEHIQVARRAGFGPIMVLPHLGGWEWAAAWLSRVAGLPVSAVVERLDPPDVFEWFRAFRESYGVEVIPLGPEAMGQVARAVRAKHVVCLLADRNIAASGIDVDFFGAPTSLPVGPALLSRRTGAPMLPTAVYFDHDEQARTRHVCHVGEPVWPVKTGSLRDDLKVMTQQNAVALEALIRRAPTQWHVLEPLWAT